MVIGIDASRAFLSRRTGIEEYSYQLIRHLRTPLRDERVILYTRTTLCLEGWRPRLKFQEIDFELPKAWRVRALFAPRFFTHGRLSLEMILRKPDALLIPAHTVPLVHPKKTAVVVHGLEYEFSMESYSLWERLYMRSVIRFSVRNAGQVIAVSENTKHDLMRLYRVPEGKISVVHEGKPESESKVESRKSKVEKSGKPYLLFIGRIEERKNISRIVEAYERLREQSGISHRLVLVGGQGYGYERIRKRIERSPYRDDIVETGYVDEAEKRTLLSEADILLFPTLYEGFGLPVIEAQVAGIPVVTSDTSSLPEVAGDGAILVDPYSEEAISDGIQSILSDREFRDDIMEKGRENAKRFDWSACAGEIAVLLKESNRSGT